MCYTCGCGMPDEDHGKQESITTKDFEKAGKAEMVSADDAKRNAYITLQHELNKKP